MDLESGRAGRLIACLATLSLATGASAFQLPSPAAHGDPASVVALAGYRGELVEDSVFGAPVYVVEAGSPDADTVVLIHGLGASASIWYDALPERPKPGRSKVSTR